jgi:2-keto-4-pentenoate hydratase
MVSPSFIDSSAAALARAWSTGTITDPPFAARIPDREQAYAIQDRMVELLAPRLGPSVGWKLGMTAPGLVDGPIVGPIHRAMLIPPGASLAARPELLIEVEIALHIRPGADTGNLTAGDLEVGTAFELLGRRTPSREVCDGIADLATMLHVVLGPTRPLAEIPDLAELSGTLAIDGETVAEGVSREAVTPPLDSLHWLQVHLATRARQLAPGDAVITGSLVGQVPVHPGTRYTGALVGLEPITVTIED